MTVYQRVRCKHCDEEMYQQEAHDHACFWQFFNPDLGVCGLCGNSGWIDTRNHVVSPRGTPCGVRRPCLCPNGRSIKVEIDPIDDSRITNPAGYANE